MYQSLKIKSGVFHSVCFAIMIMTLCAFGRTERIAGTVTSSDCPAGLDIPCIEIARLIPQCTVFVYSFSDKPQIMIYPPPNQHIAVTDDEGNFSMDLKEPMNEKDQFTVIVNHSGYQPYSSIHYASGNSVDNIAISLLVGTGIPGGTTNFISTTVYASACPPNPLMGMPCTMEPIPGATVTYYSSYGETVISPDGSVGGQTSPSFDAMQLITDASGACTLWLDPAMPAGSEIIATVEKEGYLPSKNSLILNGDPSIQLDLFIEEGTQVPLPQPAGYASVTGKVTASTGTDPVAECTVYVYAASLPYPAADGSGDIAVSSDGSVGYPDVSTGVVYPEHYYSYMAITDALGNFSIDSILVWTSDPSSLEGVFLFSAYKGAIGSVESKVTLPANTTTTVDLSLMPFPEPPQPVGTAWVTGVVRVSTCQAENGISDNCLLVPVPGCTVLVSAAYVPMMEARPDMYMPPILEKNYAAITDSKGMFVIKGLELYADEYAVVLMAQKGNLFGTAYSALQVDKEAVVDIILDDPSYVIMVDGSTGIADTVQSPEAAYYDENKAAPLAIKKSPSHRAGASIALMQNGRMVRITLPSDQAVSIEAFSMQGRKITSIVDNRQLAAGEHSFDLSALNSSGYSIIRITGSLRYSQSVLRKPLMSK